MQDDRVDLWATDEEHFQQARLPLSHVNSARNLGSGSTPCPHPQECGIFRGRAFTRWALCISPGDRQIQWQFFSIPAATSPGRRRCLHNRYFENLKDIVSAAETEFANWTTRNEALRRLCAITQDAVF